MKKTQFIRKDDEKDLIRQDEDSKKYIDFQS